MHTRKNKPNQIKTKSIKKPFSTTSDAAIPAHSWQHTALFPRLAGSRESWCASGSSLTAQWDTQSKTE